MLEKQHVWSLRHRQNETLDKSVCKTATKSLFWAPVYQDLRTCHDWSVKKVIDDLLIILKGNAKHTSDLGSPLGAENKDLSAASQTLLTRVKLCLRLTLHVC